MSRQRRQNPRDWRYPEGHPDFFEGKQTPYSLRVGTGDDNEEMSEEARDDRIEELRREIIELLNKLDSDMNESHIESTDEADHYFESYFEPWAEENPEKLLEKVLEASEDISSAYEEAEEAGVDEGDLLEAIVSIDKYVPELRGHTHYGYAGAVDQFAEDEYQQETNASD